MNDNLAEPQVSKPLSEAAGVVPPLVLNPDKYREDLAALWI